MAGTAAPAVFAEVTPENASKYWGRIDATMDGVLGGYAHIANTDMGTSLQFAQQFLGKSPVKVALDCGAGIGRVTRDVLSQLAQKVDLVELMPKYVEQAKQELAGAEYVGTFFVTSLQAFTPHPGKYDLIWIQWVIGHLTDVELVMFLQRCKQGLREDGWIVIKDNNVNPAEEGVVDGKYLIDSDDHSVMRTNSVVKDIISRAGLTVHFEEEQANFPEELCPVRMYALR